MNSFFKRIVQAVKAWLGESELRVRKKFEPGAVQRFGTQRIARSGKRFEIQRRTQSARQNVGRRRAGRFNAVGATRPKSCPLCRTTGRITRGPEQQWRCVECDFEWSA